MISSGILNIFYWFVSSLIGLLPSVSLLPDGAETAVAFIRSALSSLVDIVPSLGLFLTLVSLVILFEAGMLAFWGMNWVLNLIRGSGN